MSKIKTEQTVNKNVYISGTAEELLNNHSQIKEVLWEAADEIFSTLEKCRLCEKMMINVGFNISPAYECPQSEAPKGEGE